MYEERLRAVTVWPRKKTQGDLFYVHNYLLGVVEKVKPGFSQRSPVTEQEAMGTDSA